MRQIDGFAGSFHMRFLFDRHRSLFADQNGCCAGVGFELHLLEGSVHPVADPGDHIVFCHIFMKLLRADGLLALKEQFSFYFNRAYSHFGHFTVPSWTADRDTIQPFPDFIL